ncbi:MAG: Ig-like domain-containing protein, partial [Propionibacteriaceae bacterium]|nr:Ig-like domain-containing protein [Propionibacteriaceae bacterium]
YQAGGELVQINPMSGYAYDLPRNSTTDSAMGPLANYTLDLASGQTAQVIDGVVYNDANADGAIGTGEAGQSGVTVALYMKDPSGSDYIYEGKRTTDGSGNYSFLVGGDGDYIVRLVQPTINGVNAAQTYASGGGTLNSVVAMCVNGDISSATGGVCQGALAQPAPDPALPTALSAAGSDVSTQPGAMAIYTEVSVASDQEVANANFGITALGSFGDAAAGPASVTATPGAPVHVNGVTPSVQLGSQLGAYAGPATDGTAHNGTDDGVYVDSYAGKLSLTGTTLSATRTYDLAADVVGPAAGSAVVTGWVTGMNNNTWNATAKWTPTVANGQAQGSFQYQANGAITTPSTVQFRANASVVAETQPTNQAFDYQASATSTTNWTTPGEIEDYSFTVADAVYRVAAHTTGGTGTFTVDNQTITAGTATVVGPAKGVTAGTDQTITATAPANWQVVGATIKDTETGAVIATPAITPATSATITYASPALGSDAVIDVEYAPVPDPSRSTLTIIDPANATTTVGADITAQATIMDAAGDKLEGVTVTFANASAPATTLSAPTCVTGTDGTCTVTITSAVAGTYADELTATVPVSGQDEPITGTPTVTFTAGTPSSGPFHCPAGQTGTNLSVDKSSLTAGGTATAAALVTDANCNPLPGMAVTFALAAGTNGTVTTTQGTTGTDGKATATVTDLTAETVSLTATTPTLTDIAGSPAAIAFTAGAPDPHAVCPAGSPYQTPMGLRAAPASLPVGGNSTVTALVTDANCNPVPGATVGFTADSPAATLTPTSGVTGTDGQATAILTSSAGGLVTVTGVTGATQVGTAGVDFTLGGLSATNSTFTVSPAVSLSDPSTWRVAGQQTYTGLLTARDSNNNLLPNLDEIGRA